MKKIIFSLFAILSLLHASAQLNEPKDVEMFDGFKKDRELKSALLRFDLSGFMQDKVTFVCDTTQVVVNTSKELSKMMRKKIHVPNKAEIRKASETNNGYTQTFGIYKGDDAITYVTLTLSQEDGTLQEVNVAKNSFK